MIRYREPTKIREEPKEITEAEARAAVLQIQKNMRRGLREGTIPLQVFHHEYFGAFVLAGMSTREVEQFAELMAERAAAEMEKALDGHALNHLRAQGYTGKKGVLGWVGSGLDFFNPFDIVAMLGDLSVLLEFDPTAETAEEYLEACAKEAREAARAAGPIK